MSQINIEWDDLKDDIKVIDREYIRIIPQFTTIYFLSSSSRKNTINRRQRITLWNDYLLSLNDNNVTKIIKLLYFTTREI